MHAHIHVGGANVTTCISLSLLSSIVFSSISESLFSAMVAGVDIFYIILYPLYSYSSIMLIYIALLVCPVHPEINFFWGAIVNRIINF